MRVLCVIATEQLRVDRWTASANPNLGIDHRLLAAVVEPSNTQNARTCHCHLTQATTQQHSVTNVA